MESGDCTLCCDILPVAWLDKPANTKCIHCDKGCRIHDAKPEECTGFNCAYVQMKKASISLRPDNCKVIFELISNKLFLGTYDPREKREIVAGKQIHSFIEQGFSVMMVSCRQDKELELILGKNHDRERMTREFNKILTNRYGHTFVYN